nr:unnamed protein product [Callosobruchus chinensis]
MKVFVSLAIFLVAAQAASDKELWKQFKLPIIPKSKTIEQHNARYENGEETYYLKVTQFADMSPEEFKEFLSLGEKTKPDLDFEVIEPDMSVAAPDSIDWRERGAVLEVKNQGKCGSCWSFSATGCLEGQNAITHGQKTPLSEQNLIDCSGSYGNNACNGGVMTYAFYFVRDYGINSEASYPYEARLANCRYDSRQLGPVSVGVDASSFSLYGGGVFNPSSCSSTKINHGVLAVGYGRQGNTDYWIVKNSWGPGWGENGFIKMIRNYNNHCGIVSMASIATVHMKVFVSLAIFVVAAQAASDKELWKQFKHNARYENGEETYYLKVTQFADMSSEEFKEFLSLGEKTRPELDLQTFETDMTVAAPDSIDWREKGAVLEVKNQGQCGSCWSFSATGCLEGQNAITHGQKTPLSEQNLIDCSRGYGNNACNGGVMTYAFFYVKEQGINSEASYPYEAKLGNSQIGPVSVGVDASSFSLYGGGVFNPSSCSSTSINHGVLAVGYGREGNNDHWIVKNSWGPGWGENGYIKMIRNQNNRCGIVFVVLALFLIAAQAASDQELWKQFKSNLKIIEQHNARYENGEETYYLKVTQFADMSPEEFQELLSLGEKTRPDFDFKVFEPNMTVAAPDSFDWREKDAVLEVKNQGQCESCWAFSATGCLEGQNAITYGQQVSLSEQNLVDCSLSYGNNGCNRGVIMYAFLYVKDHGINQEKYYPYEAKLGKCRYDPKESVVQVDEAYGVKQDEEALKHVVAQIGPVAVGVDASSFSLYGGGVFKPSSCSSTSLNHGVLVVGYGREGNDNYWIVKNSWGPGWGEKGYIRMIRNQNNRCGIATAASFAILK